ncbi:hypothetical protein [Dyadobacter sp. CY347]|uniref:hypothetical protein n=1 Tax=Dyadobacter sp. CY347 TaxID=2909336 RepID=UPI001F1EDB06|nr:hypothetical protein [Dyadobacter sp. CY347]MCF2489696.1 hypothetical protein [Dyadobacter sp. CY347]
MSDISYFQKFSQPENYVTNNTLLVFRYVYRNSPAKFEALLHSLVSDENSKIPIGLSFKQQTRESHSVPDAYISQMPFNLYIEAKVDGRLYEEQIGRHLDSLRNKSHPNGSVFLLGLTKEDLSEMDESKFQSMAARDGVVFIGITYAQLANELEKLCSEYETDLKEIIEDYSRFLSSEGLFMNAFSRMVVFPCSSSRDQNVEFGIYYHPAGRSNLLSCSLIGLYKNKAVSHVGKIRGYGIWSHSSGKLALEKESGTITNDDVKRVNDLIVASPYFDLQNVDHRFYIVEKFEEVNFLKRSSGGMRGRRYFDLKSYIPNLSFNQHTPFQSVVSGLTGNSFD